MRKLAMIINLGALLGLVLMPLPVCAFQLPDTGQTQCYDRGWKRE